MFSANMEKRAFGKETVVQKDGLDVFYPPVRRASTVLLPSNANRPCSCTCNDFFLYKQPLHIL